jgi:hypothetical protein
MTYGINKGNTHPCETLARGQSTRPRSMAMRTGVLDTAAARVASNGTCFGAHRPGE